MHETCYAKGEASLAAGEYVASAEAFVTTGNYSDAAARSKEQYYVHAEPLLTTSDYVAALDSFSKAVGYQDALKSYNIKYTLGEGRAMTGGWHTVGLKQDSSVVAVGDSWSHGQCNVISWSNIVANATGDDPTVGLKADGTVVAVGWNDIGMCDISSWRDIGCTLALENPSMEQRPWLPPPR
ncbi:MAG: hypothetical protein ACI4OY_12220 [Aristaeellaceae bacterium]